MKSIKIPKFKQNDNDYKFMGIKFPKISQANLPLIMRRDRIISDTSDNDKRNKITRSKLSNIQIVHNVDNSGVANDSVSADVCDSATSCEGSGGGRIASEVCGAEVTRREKRCYESGAKAEELISKNTTPGQFDDIVFSFFSSTDQTYIVHGRNSTNSDGYVDPKNFINNHQQEARCKSIGSGNEYEIMKPAIINHYSSAADLKSNNINNNISNIIIHNGDKSDEMIENSNNNTTTTVHKSELRFFVSAASLKEEVDQEGKENEQDGNYDLPSNLVVSKICHSSYTIQNKGLNDVDKIIASDDSHPKYQNSASLDNLSQVCNISVNNEESKRSIASLPDLESSDRNQNGTKREFANGPFVFSKITAAITSKSSSRSDRSNYFDNNVRNIKLRNRISAFYSAHKNFKGKKRLSKAWYGLKDWFDNEKMKMDSMIQKHSQKRVVSKTPSPNHDYADSEFSDYEDVAHSRESIDSFGKIDDFGDSSVVSEYSNKSGRRSRVRELKDETDSNYREIRSLSACNSAVRLTSIRDGDRYFISEDKEIESNNLRHSKSQPSVILISEPSLLSKDNGENDVESSLCDEDKEVLNNVESISPDRRSVKSINCEELTDAGVITAPQQEQDNFAALKSIVKEGSVMCKELITILQQRAEAERQYCCGVLRVGARARRASKGASWAALASRRAAIDMEARAQLHRQFANKLVEEIIRPLQRMVSSRDAFRKQVENDVGVTMRRLLELREIEGRCKKASHAAARCNERLQDTSVAKGATQGQEADLRRKKIKSEEAANKTDVEYYMACVRAERARVEWEIAVAKGLETLVDLEEERLRGMRKTLKLYVKLAAMLGPGPPSEESKQLDTMLSGALKGEGRVARGLLNAAPPPMHLPDFYCLHITLAMNKERRRQALMRILQLIKNDMERERKSKQALEKLSLAITTTPNFGNNESQQNVSEKLYHMRSLLTYLEGARVQAAGALLALGGRQRPSHPLTPHITVQRDRRGLQQTILQVPPWLRQEFRPVKAPAVSSPFNSPPGTPAPCSVARSSPPPSPGSSVAWHKDRGVADGVSVQHYSDVEEHIVSDTPPARPPPPVLPMMKSHHEFSV